MCIFSIFRLHFIAIQLPAKFHKTPRERILTELLPLADAYSFLLITNYKTVQSVSSLSSEVKTIIRTRLKSSNNFFLQFPHKNVGAGFVFTILDT